MLLSHNKLIFCMLISCSFIDWTQKEKTKLDRAQWRGLVYELVCKCLAKTWACIFKLNTKTKHRLQRRETRLAILLSCMVGHLLTFVSETSSQQRKYRIYLSFCLLGYLSYTWNSRTHHSSTRLFPQQFTTRVLIKLSKRLAYITSLYDRWSAQDKDAH